MQLRRNGIMRISLHHSICTWHFLVVNRDHQVMLGLMAGCKTERFSARRRQNFDHVQQFDLSLIDLSLNNIKTKHKRNKNFLFVDILINILNIFVIIFVYIY